MKAAVLCALFALAAAEVYFKEDFSGKKRKEKEKKLKKKKGAEEFSGGTGWRAGGRGPGQAWWGVERAA